MILSRSRIGFTVFLLPSACLAAGGGLLLAPRWTLSGSLVRGVSVISAGERIAVQPNLRRGGMTLFAFYTEASALERGAITRLERQAAARGALRRIPLASLAAPAARQFGITETPTFLAYDRDGRLRLRSSRLEEIQRLLNQQFSSASRTPARPAARVCPFSARPRLAWVEESSSQARRVYRRWGGGRTAVPDIYKAMSLRPDLMERVADLTDRAHFHSGFLPRRTKEMIATYVSSLNRCGYCRSSHAENLRALGVSARHTQAIVRQDLKAAALTPKERALLAFVKTLTSTPAAVTDAQIAQLRRAGWRDGEIFEAAFDTSLFAFFNRIADTYGLH